jgi:hypothetical protein
MCLLKAKASLTKARAEERMASRTDFKDAGALAGGRLQVRLVPWRCSPRAGNTRGRDCYWFGLGTFVYVTLELWRSCLWGQQGVCCHIKCISGRLYYISSDGFKVPFGKLRDWKRGGFTYLWRQSCQRLYNISCVSYGSSCRRSDM